jgi:hypothetical protein
LSAWVKSSGGQNSAVIAARNFGGTDLSYSIGSPIGTWRRVTLPEVDVSNGQCKVAIVSDAKANNWVQVDDVSLVSNSPGSVSVAGDSTALATPAVVRPSMAPAPAAQVPNFATVADAQREAVRRYPQLGVAGSPFNVQFIALFKRYQQERPALFRDSSWPLQIAEAVAHPAPVNGGQR